LGVHRQTVQRCVERAVAYGPMAALDDRPRSGKEPPITAGAKAWLVSLASKETKAWLADQPTGRFEFTFTPKHGSWLNLVEGFFPSWHDPSCATSV
jgi:hypothetical protein